MEGLNCVFFTMIRVPELRGLEIVFMVNMVNLKLTT